MVYPTLPADAKAVSIFEQGLSPYYDIVWSVTYRVDNLTEGDELGLCMFLQDQSQPLSGGGIGIDLGYSGLSADNALYSTSVGLLSAVIGIGLDSTGQFPLSVQWPDGTVRDGLQEDDRVLNSVSVRGSYPDYPYLSGSNTEITQFDIADSQKKTLRARLGNYGRTIYLDYKRNDGDSFTNILTKDVDIPFNETTRFRPGVSITKPISSNVTPNNQIVIEAFHIEGNDEVTESNIEIEFTPLSAIKLNYTIEEDEDPPTSPDPTDTPAIDTPPSLPPLPPGILPEPLQNPRKNCGDVIYGNEVDEPVSQYVYRITGTQGDVTLSYTLSTPPLTSIDTSLSAASYEFESIEGTNYGQLSVNILSSYITDLESYGVGVNSKLRFENLNNLIDNKELTITGLYGYPVNCLFYINEFNADTESPEVSAISAIECAEFLSAFTVILTGGYSYDNDPIGVQIPSDTNRIFKLEERFDRPFPVRFNVEYDNVSYYDTGYVGSKEYSYGGAFRQDFIDIINKGTSIQGFTLSSDLLPGVVEPDGYPSVVPFLSGTNTYNKGSDSVRANVTVYDVMSSKDWSFTLSCPQTATPPTTTLYCNTSTTESYDGLGYFTHETITLDESDLVRVVTLRPRVLSTPQRFIVVYDNQTVIDTGYILDVIDNDTLAYSILGRWNNIYIFENSEDHFNSIWSNPEYYELIDKYNITFEVEGQEIPRDDQFYLRSANGDVESVVIPFAVETSSLDPNSLSFIADTADKVDVFVISAPPINKDENSWEPWSYTLNLDCVPEPPPVVTIGNIPIPQVPRVPVIPRLGPGVNNVIIDPSENITSSDSVTISTDVTSDYDIISVVITWGTESGSYPNEVLMSISTGDTYVGVIPAQQGITSDTTVYYRIEAVDSGDDTHSVLTVSDEQSYTVTDPPSPPSS